MAPREQFSALERSRILKRIDDQAVWSISCLFVDKNHREKGVSVQLATAAVDCVAGKGGKIVEAYPVEPKKERSPPAFVWTGLAAGFKKTGFKECARRSETRPIMRFFIQ